MTGASPAAGGSTGTLETIVPVGSPQTGLGGAARTGNDDLLLLAAASLALAGIAFTVGIRRRRTRTHGATTESL